MKTLDETIALCGSLSTFRHTDPGVRDVLAAAHHHIRALQAFKHFVHQRLDEAGVPTHPDGPHSKEGCRVGDRLDIVLTVFQEAQANG